VETIFPTHHLTGAKKLVFLKSHLADTSKCNKYNYNQMTTQKPKQQLIKTTNVCKTKSNETTGKASFRSPFMSSGQEMDRDYNHNHNHKHICKVP